jgi:hypothetical protein
MIDTIELLEPVPLLEAVTGELPLTDYYSMMTRKNICNYVDTQGVMEVWIWNYGGTGKNGIDCSALTSLLFSSVYGVGLPRTAREQYSKCKKVKREDLTEGDLVFFNTRGGVSHVGVYLTNDYFVHASTSNGVTISSLNDNYYRKKYIGGGRHIIPSSTN